MGEVKDVREVDKWPSPDGSTVRTWIRYVTVSCFLLTANANTNVRAKTTSRAANAMCMCSDGNESPWFADAVETEVGAKVWL